MLADLERCVGCQTCTAACRHANATSPSVQWRKVLDVESGSYPDVRRTFVPVGCQHCDDPPCMHVCPTTATRKRADGIVTIDYGICIGCAYCDVACPYQARFKIEAPRFAYGRAAMPQEEEREDPELFGVAQKCTFCVNRIDAGLARGLTPGIDPEATPACVNSCIATALHFGDVDDPNSNVSQLLREQKHFRMHDEVGTGSRFYYLYAGAGADADGEAQDEAFPLAGQGRTKGVEPWHQKHWDWKAAGNFMCGGAAAGLFAFVAASLVPALPQQLLGLAAIGLMGLGLLLVLLKIGRPMRALNVFRQPQRSWMAREAWIAAVFFPLALAALWTGNTVLTVIAGLLSLCFLYAQAMILKESKGIPAWREPLLVPFIVATGLAEGCGLLLMALPLFPLVEQPVPQPIVEIAAIGLVLLVGARALAWRAYVAALVKTGAPSRTLQNLDAVRVPAILAGLALPLILAAVGFVAGDFGPWLFALAGLSAFAAGWLLKFRLVTRAGYNQGFALEHVPVRGSGHAGGAVKPGWTKSLHPVQAYP
jgi:phenylacetyl-CoA:acceptor oxidoreductase subunit 1